MVRIRSKRWCFTLNNPTQEEEDLLLTQGEEIGNDSNLMIPLTYLIFGKEYGQGCNTLHFQGYLELKKKLSLSSVKEFLTRAHWEKAKGTGQQASDYCKKDGDFVEFGTLNPGQGARTDLLKIKDMIKDGASELEIAEDHFKQWVVYRRSFTAYRSLLSTSRSWPTKVHVIWGKTGTGKTRYVWDQVMDSSAWTPGDFKWFDGYTGQRIAIFDDYRGEYPLQMLLKLCDRYPMQVPIKGGFVEWKPTKIYITSNINPSYWYPNADRYSLAAMFRRFSRVDSVFEDLY